MAETPTSANPEEPGGMSQSDIDAAPGETGEPAADAPSPSDEGGAPDQAAINAAVAGGGETDAADSSAPADAGELDQAAIDAALAGGAGGADDSRVASEPAAEDTRVDSTGRPFDAAAAAMAAAIEEEGGAAGDAGETTAAQDLPVENVSMPDFGEGGGSATPVHGIDLLNDVSLRVRIELGRTRMYVEDVLRLGKGSVVELNKLAGDPVDVFVNDRLVARGEVLVLNDNFCVRVGEIISDENERLVG